jgi:Ca2+-binding RTX toxin-like protein
MIGVPLIGQVRVAGAAPLCFGLVPTIVGGGQIDGTPGDDVIVGSRGPDAIAGHGGNDTICGLGGSDWIRAVDTASLSWLSARIDGGVGDDVLEGAWSDQGGENLLRGGPGNDTLLGGVYATNTLSGGDGDDELIGADIATNDIHGDAGNDTIEGGHGGTNDLQGDTGNDTVTGGRGYTQGDGTVYEALNEITGGAGDDVLAGGSGEYGPTDNVVLADTGTDYLTAGDYAHNQLDGGRDGDVDTCVQGFASQDELRLCDVIV